MVLLFFFFFHPLYLFFCFCSSFTFSSPSSSSSPEIFSSTSFSKYRRAMFVRELVRIIERDSHRPHCPRPRPHRCLRDALARLMGNLSSSASCSNPYPSVSSGNTYAVSGFLRISFREDAPGSAFAFAIQTNHETTYPLSRSICVHVVEKLREELREFQISIADTSVLFSRGIGRKFSARVIRSLVENRGSRVSLYRF